MHTTTRTRRIIAAAVAAAVACLGAAAITLAVTTPTITQAATTAQGCWDEPNPAMPTGAERICGTTADAHPGSANFGDYTTGAWGTAH
jgi:hypothetical protein